MKKQAKKQAKKVGGKPIVPPEPGVPPDTGTDPEAGTEAGPGGADLRMPPLLDHDAPHRFTRWLGRAAYRLSLIGLGGLLSGFVILALVSAGGIKVPDWTAWREAAYHMISRPAATPVARPATVPDGQETSALAGDSAPDAADAADALGAPDALDAAHQQVVDLQTALAETRHRLAAVEQQLHDRAAASDAAPDAAPDSAPDAAPDAALADILLRLQSGRPFDDLRDSGTLARVLQADEVALLAPYARRGLPRWADLRAHAQTLPSGDATAEDDADLAAPDLAGADLAGAGLPVALVWLADKAPALVRIRRAPPTGVPSHYRDLHRHISRRDLAATEQTLRRLIVLGDAGAADNAVSAHPTEEGDALHVLYALYEDVQAMRQTDTLLRALRTDYLNGARP